MVKYFSSLNNGQYPQITFFSDFKNEFQTKEKSTEIPELKACVGQDNVDLLSSCSEDCQQEILSQCFHSLMTTAEEDIASALDKLIQRLSSLDESSRGMHLADLVERLHSQFPGDVGVFGPYMFNHLTLHPGEAIYLAANEPHAYLFGDCVECMACSDNTVRAGLTPKLKDVPTLCRLLTFACEPAMCKMFSGMPEDQNTTVFRPPVPDFAVAMISVEESQAYSLIARSSASISIVISGSASSPTLPLHRGSIFFLPSGETLAVTVTSSDPLKIFQAYANV